MVPGLLKFDRVLRSPEPQSRAHEGTLTDRTGVTGWQLIREENTGWYTFRFAGERIDEPTRSTSRTVAKETERQHRRSLEAGYNNFKEVRQNRVRILEEIIAEYLTGYRLRYRSATFAEDALGHVGRLLGTKIVADITEISVTRRTGSARRLRRSRSMRGAGFDDGILGRHSANTRRRLSLLNCLQATFCISPFDRRGNEARYLETLRLIQLLIGFVSSI